MPLKNKEKITKNENRILISAISDRDLFGIMLDFQGNDYSLYEAQRLLGKKSTSKECEIFPGIYLKKRKNDFLRRIYYQLRHLRYYEIVVENKKDHFDVREGPRKESEYHDETLTYKQLENIRPSEILWPEDLGGGKVKGCRLYDYFEVLGLKNTTYYGFCSEKGIVEYTKAEPFFDSLCKENECYEYYTDIVNNGYKVRVYDNKEDHIEVTMINDNAVANEGKHRICCLKRFGYDREVPALVSRIKRTGEYNRVFTNVFYRGNAETMKSIVDEFYTTCDRLGIEKEDARKALRDGDNIVGLLKRSKYSFEELYEINNERLKKELKEALGSCLK